ncbi:hypothetical protein ACQ4LE_004991 [Meloidogyne hapla]|uniref:Imm43 domain-containing protein n=1 Tax=Meloidogyne hapla TaxID=6305 RepID=A0A1I8B9P4_MELHA
MLVYDEMDEEPLYHYVDMCYYENKYIEEYCNLDIISSPIKAKFNDDVVYLFVDEIIDSEGKTIVNITRKTTFCLDMYFCWGSINGNKEDISKITEALDSHKEDIGWYLDGECRDNKIKRKELGLKFKDLNITINFDGKDLAEFTKSDKCFIGINDYLGDIPLQFSLQIFNKYCILVDTKSEQIAFTPRREIKELEWSKCFPL